MKKLIHNIVNAEIRSILALLIALGCFSIVIVMMFHPIPIENKDLVNIAIGALLTGGLASVVSFYFGAVKNDANNNNQNNQQMPTVFWDIQSLQDPITSINGQQVQYANAQALVNANQNYSIVQDDTNVSVLIVNTQATLGLTHNGSPYQVSSVVAEFAGGRPTRPR